MTQATTTPGLLNPPPKFSLLPPCAPNMQTQGACEPESGEGLPGKPCPSCTSFQVKAQGWTPIAPCSLSCLDCSLDCPKCPSSRRLQGSLASFRPLHSGHFFKTPSTTYLNHTPHLYPPSLFISLPSTSPT